MVNVTLYEHINLDGEPDQTSLAIHVVRTDEGFDALEPEWKHLVEESNATIFQTFEWLRPWWTYLGSRLGRRLHIVLFHQAEELVGAAPLFEEKAWGATRLHMLGGEISDYHDLIIKPGYEERVLHACARYLKAIGKKWDVLDVKDVAEVSITYRLLPPLFEEHGFEHFMRPVNVCPQRQLPETWDEFFASLGSNGRYNYKRKNRALRDQFKDVEMELIQDADEDIASAIESFAQLHGLRWTSLGYPSAFDDATHKEFHTKIASGFAKNGWLRIWFLKVQGKRVAVMFNFMYKGRIYMYQSNAFAANEIMRHSPGFLVHCHAIQKGIEEGMTVLDFLRGDESYKIDGMKSELGQNWGIRITSPCTSQWRYRGFIVGELLAKATDRLRREWYALRRFRISGKSSPAETIKYILTRLKDVLQVGLDFVVRYTSKSKS